MSFVRRLERKFEVTPKVAAELRAAVEKHLPVYQFASSQGAGSQGAGSQGAGARYTNVTTVYFDTLDRQFYRRASKSYDDHQKLRVKEYSQLDADGTCRGFPYRFIELKELEEGRVSKRRIPLSKLAIPGFLKRPGSDESKAETTDWWGDVTQHQSKDAMLRAAYDSLRDFVARYEVAPTSVICYRREVFQESAESETALRITFDDQITVHEAEADVLSNPEVLGPPCLSEPVRRFENVILEIKCPGSYPEWLQRALLNHSARKLSKFTESVRSLDESLERRFAKRKGDSESARSERPEANSGRAPKNPSDRVQPSDEDTNLSNQSIQS